MKVSSCRFMVNLLTCLLVLFRIVNLSSLTAYSAHWRSRVPIDLWEPLGTKKSDLYMTLHLGLASQHDYQASLSLCLHLLTSQSPSLAALMSWLPSLAMLRCTQQQRLVVPTQMVSAPNPVFSLSILFCEDWQNTIFVQLYALTELYMEL